MAASPQTSQVGLLFPQTGANQPQVSGNAQTYANALSGVNQAQTLPGVGGGLIPPPEGSMNTQAMVKWRNTITGETQTVSSGGYTAPPGSGWEIDSGDGGSTSPGHTGVNQTSPGAPASGQQQGGQGPSPGGPYLGSYISSMDLIGGPSGAQQRETGLMATHEIRPWQRSGMPPSPGGVTGATDVPEGAPEVTGPGQYFTPWYQSIGANAQAAANLRQGTGARVPLTPQEKLFGRGVNFTPSGASNPYLGYANQGGPTMTVSGTPGSSFGQAANLASFFNR